MITHKQYPNHHILRPKSAAAPSRSRPARLPSSAMPRPSAATATPSSSVTAVASPLPKAGIDYFPLTIEVEERMYAVGRIPGSFNRREGKPSDRGVLISRLIDRPMRPLFDEELRNDVVLTNTILAQDYDNPVEIVASIGSSLVIAYSDIPWNGPHGHHERLLSGRQVYREPVAGRAQRLPVLRDHRVNPREGRHDRDRGQRSQGRHPHGVHQACP